MASWMTTWPILGLLFMLAGLSHFSNAEGKCLKTFRLVFAILITNYRINYDDVEALKKVSTVLLSTLFYMVILRAGIAILLMTLKSSRARINFVM